MNEFQRLLLIVDPAMHRTAAFERAAALAAHTGAELHLRLFDHHELIAAAALLDEDAATQAREAFMQQRRAWLDTEAGILRRRGITITCGVIWAHPVHEEILSQVLELQPDLVLKDVHVERLLKRALFTPLDWKLLRLCPAPLLLVNRTSRRTPQRIIVAVDPHDDANANASTNSLDDQVIQAAMMFAEQCHAELHLVHVCNDQLSMLTANGDASPLLPIELSESLRGARLKAFDALADRYRIPSEQRHFLSGPLASTLTDFARDADTDVIVVGTVRRRGLERLVMGSSAERILDSSPCSVLAIKPVKLPVLLAADMPRQQHVQRTDQATT